MDGNNKEQIRQMKLKATAFADQIRSSTLSHSESWHALKTTIMKTMEYPMEAINLTKKQWDSIMTPILRCALPKSGISRTFPRTILYSPLSYSGSLCLGQQQDLLATSVLKFEGNRGKMRGTLLIARQMDAHSKI